MALPTIPSNDTAAPAEILDDESSIFTTMADAGYFRVSAISLLPGYLLEALLAAGVPTLPALVHGRLAIRGGSPNVKCRWCCGVVGALQLALRCS